MKIIRTPLAASLFVALTITALCRTAHAQTFVETTDAGQTLLTAANTGTFTPTSIRGTLGNATDADLYQIAIAKAGTYTFSTNNAFTNTAGTDTELSFFTPSGAPMLLNDDASSTSFASTITLSLTATGTYYLGIAVTGNEPVNSVNQMLFSPATGAFTGDTTVVRSPASGVNPTTLANFNGNASYDGSGAYMILITSVPEPSTWAIVALGGIATASTLLRRRKV